MVKFNAMSRWGIRMEKSFLLAKANLRKTKGQTTAIIILILLAASMLNLWLMLSIDYKQNFDRYHKKLNAQHVTLVIDRNNQKMREFLIQTMKSDKNITEFSLDDAMYTVGLFTYNGGEVNSGLVFLEKQAAISRSIGKVEIIEDSEIESGIYMPMLYKSDDIAVGKTVTIFIGSNKISYTVCGFFNSIMAGSHNCGMCEIILTKDKYDELKKMGYMPESIVCSVRLQEKTESADYETVLKNAVSTKDPTAKITSNSYMLVSQSRYISQNICSSIISVMAFLILLIALVVIVSNIVNYIQEDMKNLGALKAVGYTSRQLIASLFTQFWGISLVAAIAGTGISYGLFPFVNIMMISQTGIPYKTHFLLWPLLITFLILEGTITAAVWLSARRIKKINPIVALRQGIPTHNFKYNHIPLEKTKISLGMALAFKTAFSDIKYNITVCITMLVLSLVVVFSGLMIENVIADITPFLDLVVGEIADSCVNINAETESRFLREMEADEQVEKIYLYNSLAVSHIGGLELLATICDDFAKVNNQNTVVQGRFPKFYNEIAIAAKYAKEENLKIGDEITIMAGGKKAEYIISGFTQISNNLGKDCLLTREGYERLGEMQSISYYLNLTDGSSIDDFHLKIKERFKDQVNMMVNIKLTIEGAASVYVSLVTMIVILILVLSAVIITFVLYLLVRTMLNKKKRDYGIMKALGFTTVQLILQTAVSFMPAVIISTTVGLIVNSWIINPLIAVFLSGIGIVKCTFGIPADFIVISGIGLILFAFAIVCLLSLKIKKIAPKALLAGD